MGYAFRVRMFRAFSALMTAVYVLVMGCMFAVLVSKNREVARVGLQEQLHSETKELTNTFSAMRDLSQLILADASFLQAFENAAQDTEPGNYFLSGADAQIVQERLAQMGAVDSVPLRVCAYNYHGDLAWRQYDDSDALVTADTLKDSRYYTGQYSLIVENGGDHVISGPHPDHWTSSGWSDLCVSYLCFIRSPIDHDAIYGILDLQYDMQQLQQLDFFRERDDSYCVLLDNFGRTGFREYVTDEQAKEIYDGLREAYDTSGVYQMAFRHDGQRFIATGQLEESSQWMLVRVCRASVLDEGYAATYALLAVLMVGLLGVILWVIRRVTARMTGPLTLLTESIERVNLNNMQALPELPEIYQTQELVRLNRAFNTMLQRLEGAFRTEMNAYALAMQSQMDPHFIYNALSMIAEYAEENQPTRTSELCQELGELLRAKADYSTELIPLREEIDVLRHYLNIMQARYEGFFTYEIEPCAALDDFKVPRLLLQPMAENCFKHGFKNAAPPWHIRLRVRCTEETWELYMQDNGAGFSAQDIERVYRRIEEFRADPAGNYKQLRIDDGLGLASIVLRLLLMGYGDIRFRIESPPGGGAAVVIGGTL